MKCIKSGSFADAFSPHYEISRLKHASVAITLMVLVSSVAYPQGLTPQRDRRYTPVFTVEVWDHIMTDFSTRVWSYYELRSELEKGLPPRRVTDDPGEILWAVRALANKIRVARAEAKEGDIFAPSISAEFKKALVLEMNAQTWASIMDDNPGEFSTQINGSYPYEKPLSTVPPNILALLPALPDGIQYRFLGRHIILYDTRASLIIDRIHHAIRREP